MSLLDSSDAVVGTATTDVSGYYRFDDLVTGAYRVRVDAANFTGAGVLVGYESSDTTQADPNSDTDNDDNGINPSATTYTSLGVLSGPLTLSEPELTGETDASATPGSAADNRANLSLDFGFYRLSIGNKVWLDTNNDGIAQSGESPIPNVRVEFRDAANTVVAFTNTDSTGNYSFDRLTNGSPLRQAPTIEW